MMQNLPEKGLGRFLLGASLIVVVIWGAMFLDVQVIRHLEGADVWPDVLLAILLTFGLLFLWNELWASAHDRLQ